jgi:hypothetical protein
LPSAFCGNEVQQENEAWEKREGRAGGQKECNWKLFVITAK